MFLCTYARPSTYAKGLLERFSARNVSVTRCTNSFRAPVSFPLFRSLGEFTLQDWLIIWTTCRVKSLHRNNSACVVSYTNLTDKAECYKSTAPRDSWVLKDLSPRWKFNSAWLLKALGFGRFALRELRVLSGSLLPRFSPWGFCFASLSVCLTLL